MSKNKLDIAVGEVAVVINSESFPKYGFPHLYIGAKVKIVGITTDNEGHSGYTVIGEGSSDVFYVDKRILIKEAQWESIKKIVLSEFVRLIESGLKS